MLSISLNRILPYKTGVYLNSVISERTIKFDKNEYYKEYNAMLKHLDNFVKSMNEKGYNCSRSEILYYINRDFSYTETSRKDLLYWNISGKSKEANKLMYYKHDKNNEYKLISKHTVKFNAAPDIWIFGNCTILTESDGKNIYYLSTEHRLLNVTQRNNLYYGYTHRAV